MKPVSRCSPFCRERGRHEASKSGFSRSGIKSWTCLVFSVPITWRWLIKQRRISIPDFWCAAIDDFCQYIEKPTVLVLDNAPVHRSKLFQEQLEKWQEKDLYVFFLPRYCPHLNKAETFWRKAKYEWLKPSDYASFAKYERKVKEIFNQIGLRYKLNFKELKDKVYFVWLLIR